MKFLSLLILSVSVFVSMAPHASAKVISGRIELTFPDDKMPDVEKGWVGIDLMNDKQLDNPAVGSGEWNLRFKQMYPGTNQGKVFAVKLKKGSTFESITQAFDDESQYVADEFDAPPGPGNGKTFYSKAMMKWCAYIWEPWLEPQHGCVPQPIVFVLKTAQGRYAKVQVVRYVKNGKERGSLESGPQYGEDGKVHVTLRYSMNTEIGSRVLE